MSAKDQGGPSVIQQLSAYVTTEILSAVHGLESLDDVAALARLLSGGTH